MEKRQPGQTREERLAAKLRENLRRRKAQAKAMEDSAGHRAASPGSEVSGEGLFDPEQ